MYVAYDNFSRNAEGSFGAAIQGNTWTTLGPSNLTLSVVKGHGSITGNGEAELMLGQDGQVQQNVEVQTWFSIQQSATAVGLFARRTSDGSAYYRAALYVDENNNATLKLEVNNGSVITLQQRNVTIVPGTYYHLKFRMQSSVLAAKLWQSQHPEPLNWTIQCEHLRFMDAGQTGLYAQAATTMTTPVLKLASYHITELGEQGEYDHFHTLANWRTFSNADGSATTSPTYPYSQACTNNYIHLWGGANGGLNIRCDASNGSRNIVYLQSVRNFTLPATFACKMRINGPITGGLDLLKVVKAFYGVGGDAVGPRQYIEHDFEACLEPLHPFMNAYPGALTPSLLCSTYSDGAGTIAAHPALPIPLDIDIFNGWFTFAFSVSVFSQSTEEIVYKSDFYMMSARSAPNYQFIGTTYTTHDPSTIYEQAYIDLHYVDTSQTSQSSTGNPQNLSIQWFYYSPQPNKLPTL